PGHGEGSRPAASRRGRRVLQTPALLAVALGAGLDRASGIVALHLLPAPLGGRSGPATRERNLAVPVPPLYEPRKVRGPSAAPARRVPFRNREGRTDAAGLALMKFSPCSVSGAWLIEPTPHEDPRGRFMRAWCGREFAEHAIDFTPVQANMGLSLRKGTLR